MTGRPAHEAGGRAGPDRPRVLLVAATTGYQVRSFDAAAARLGVDLALATDRCVRLDDPWRDGAVPIRFHDGAAAVRAIAGAAASRGFDAILAVGDRPAVVAARAAHALGLPGHPPAAAARAADKLQFRRRLRDAGLPAPWFREASAEPGAPVPTVGVRFPCVVKPRGLAASRGVMRADTPAALAAAVARLRRLLAAPDVRALRDPGAASIVIEEYLPGREVALEGVVTAGALHVFALFDKPDPLEGPFFEETVYVTPDTLPPPARAAVVRAVAGAVRAIGLGHGPVHAECRIGPRGVVVLEAAARPIGGRCAAVLRFDGPAGGGHGLEEVLIRHALGEPAGACRVARDAAGVMMIPVPRAGICLGVDGVDAARASPGIEAVTMTVKPGQRLVPWPEGASCPGFLFARGATPAAVAASLRAAHRRLTFRMTQALPVRPVGGAGEDGEPRGSGAPDG